MERNPVCLVANGSPVFSSVSKSLGVFELVLSRFFSIAYSCRITLQTGALSNVNWQLSYVSLVISTLAIDRSFCRSMLHIESDVKLD